MLLVDNNRLFARYSPTHGYDDQHHRQDAAGRNQGFVPRRVGR
jgi:hypothetical protein